MTKYGLKQPKSSQNGKKKKSKFFSESNKGNCKKGQNWLDFPKKHQKSCKIAKQAKLSQNGKKIPIFFYESNRGIDLIPIKGS